MSTVVRADGAAALPRGFETVPPVDGLLTVERVTMRLAGHLVVDQCSFVLEPKVLTAMIGPSGCGKSTLAFLVAGYHQPTRGRVLLDGQLVRGPSAERLLVFQESALLPWLTVAQNVMFGPQARGARREDARRTALAVLDRVGLLGFADRYPAQLSGGMQRRAELARALVNDPRVLVLDEPFRGLDAMTRGLMQEYFSELWANSSNATLFITNNIDEAVLLADRLLVMSAAPTTVSEVIDIDLPRPRRREDLPRNARAREIKKRVLQRLKVEALKQL